MIIYKKKLMFLLYICLFCLYYDLLWPFIGPREQINSVTSYIDGSMVYGSSDAQMTLLRDVEGGK